MARARKIAAPVELDIARKIWLAGVGAYGRMYAETAGALDKLSDQANETFEQLVARGEVVEDQVRAMIAATPQAGKVVGLVNDMAKRAREYRQERQAALVARMTEARKTIEHAVEALNPLAQAETVESLAAELKALRAEVATLKGQKPARRTAVKAAKPAAKKAVRKAVAKAKVAAKPVRRAVRKATKR